MKKIFLLLLIIFLTGYASGNFPDSLIINHTKISSGQTFRTGYFTSFQRYYFQSFIEDDNGGLHISYVDNYELFYYKSTDNGLSWTGQKVITGHEGDIFGAALTVDDSGYVYFGITVHNLFNYCNPSGVGSGTEFSYDVYCVHNKSGSWTSELIYTHSSANYGARAVLLYTDNNRNVHLICNYYGWMSYGGTIWEWIRYASTNTWSPQKTIVTFSDAGIDKFIYDNFVFLHNSQDKKILVLTRTKGTDNQLFYLTNPDSVWSAPQVINNNIASLSSFYAALDQDDHVYVAYLVNTTPGKPDLKISKDFGTAQTANITLAPNDTLTSVRILCDTDGLLTMTLYRKYKNASFSFSTDGFNWTDPVESDSVYRYYWGGLMQRTNTNKGIFSSSCKHINVVAGPRTAQPYGPDTLIFGSIRLLPYPNAPVLLTPQDSTFIDSNSVEFSWEACYPEVNRYWFEIANNPEFSSSYIDSLLTNTSVVYNDLDSNIIYYWRVRAANPRGWGTFSETYTLFAIIVGVNDINQLHEYSLSQNYPNPFNPVTTIEYSIRERVPVHLSVINLLGEEAALLVNQEKESGNYKINFDASGLPSGTYFIRLKAGENILIRKMILLK